jgi:hypothetical protein
MFTLAGEPTLGPTASPVFPGPLRPELQAGRAPRWPRLALALELMVLPAAAGLLFGRATTLRRRLLEAGGTVIAFGVLRIELARWFCPEPAFEAAGTHGDLELRRYPARIEACARVDDTLLDRAIDHGFGRLACYACGANQGSELIARMIPILTAVDDGYYTVSFVMPPDRTLDELPQPTHPGVTLRKIPARRIAALRFRGHVTRESVAAHEHVLLQQLVDAGLSAQGSVSLAAFDSPATLPCLRRNELWIEVV